MRLPADVPGWCETPEQVKQYVHEVVSALLVTQRELSSLRSSCYALDALLTELGFPTSEEKEARFGFDAALRVSRLRAMYLDQIEALERARNESSAAWSELRESIHTEPEYSEAGKNGAPVWIHKVAIAVLGRLRRELEPRARAPQVKSR